MVSVCSAERRSRYFSIYGGFQLRLPTRALAVRVPLGIALAPVLAGHYHGQAMFLAQPVADAPDVGIALSVGNILSLIDEYMKRHLEIKLISSIVTKAETV